MTKPNEDMDVVEMDAINHGDWETNMSTSELPVAGLAALVRQTAAAPVMEQRQPPRIAPTAVRPSVSIHTPVPVKAPPILAPPPEPVDEPIERAPSLRPSRRILLIAAGAAAALGIVVGIIVVRGSSPRATEVASTAPHVVAAPEPHAIAAPPKPTATKPAAIAATPKPSATKQPAIAATPRPANHEPARRQAVVATKHAKPAHASHAPAAKKHVATRAPVPPVEPDVLDRAHVAYNTGNEALFAGDTAAAIRSYQDVVGLSPLLAFGYRGLGLAYAQSGESIAAIKALRRYLELAPHAKDAVLIRKRLNGLQHPR